MGFIEIILHPQMALFSGALLLVIGLLTLELIAAAFGGSFLATDEPGAEIELDADLDVDADVDLDADFDPEIDADASAADAPNGLAAALAWLGIGQAPLLIWIAGVLTGFGLSGYALQIAAEAAFGDLAPWAAVAALAGLMFGARFAMLIGRIAPKMQTSAISRRHFGGRVGVLVQGVARRGRPAQARFTDRHGEIHHVLVEPFDDADTIHQGEDIIILRGDGRVLRALRLDDAPAKTPPRQTLPGGTQ